jgi:hypothetical protein
MISSITSSHALDVAREQRHAPDGLRRARTLELRPDGQELGKGGGKASELARRNHRQR